MKRQFNGFRLLVGSFLLGMLLPGATALADPIVNIESPLGTEPLVLNKSTRVEVTVTNADVPILSVDIYRDGILLGEADPAGGNSWSLDFTPASLSPFELYAEAMDDDGVTWVSDTLEYTVVQPEAPKVSILAPFEGSIHPTGTEVPVQLTAHDPYGIIRQVDLLLNGETLIQYTWNPGTRGWEPFPPNPEAIDDEEIPYRINVLLPSPGDYDLQARVVSTTGLDEFSETVTVTAKDLSTSPALSILSPVSGSRYLPGTILPVQVEAYDPDGLIEQVEFLLNDVVVATAAAAPFRADVELPSTGTYALTARCTTGNGAVAYSQEVILEAGPPDAVSPRVVLDFPLPLGGGDTVNDVSYASAMFFNATATDPDGGTIEDVRFYINGQFLGNAESQLGDVFSRFYQPNAQGNYVISAEAVDNDGNVGWSVPLLLDVGPLERQLPQAAVKEPANAVEAGRTMDFFVEADGGLIPIDRVDLFVDGIYVGSSEEALADGTFAISWTPVATGTYDLQARVVQIDPAGATYDNWKITEPLTITVTEPSTFPDPVVEILTPFDGTVQPTSKTLPIRLNAYDPNGLISQVEMSLNGQTIIRYVIDNANGTWNAQALWPFVSPGENIPLESVLALPSTGDYLLQARVVSTTGEDGLSETVLLTGADTVTTPVLNILSPVTGSRYLPGTILPVQVEAFDPGGLIQEVEFLLNGAVVGTVTGAPYRAEVQLPSTGTYVLTARAATTTGAQAVSQEVILEAGAPDAVSPRVVIDFPLPLGGGDTVNDVSYASAMFFNATATDPDGGTIEDVRFYINGQFLGGAESQLGDVYSRFYQPNAQGNYVISAEAVDNDGNVGWSVPLLLDVGPLERQLPQAAVREPASAVQAGRAMDFFVEADGGLIPIDRVDLFVDGIYVGSSEEALADGTFAISWTPVATGTYDLQARVVQIDPAGATYDNWKITDALTITVTEPATLPDPEVEILSPFDGNIVATSVPFAVNLSAYDPNGLIHQIELSLNGETIIRYTGDSDSWQAEVLWPNVSAGGNFPMESILTLPSVGDYLLQARVVSTTGEAGLSETVLLTTVDAVTTPVLNILAPVSGSRYLPGTILPVQVEAYDPGGLVEEVEFLLNGVIVDSVASAPFRSDVQLPSTGTYVLTARAMTSSGAQAFSQEVTLEAGPPDEVSPRIVIDFPLPLGAGDTVNDVSYASAMFFNATATDPDGGTIEDVRFYINGQFLGSAENQLGDVYSRFYQPNAQGNYVISAEAVDNDGNVGWSVPLLLDVGPLERQLPEAEMVQPFPKSILGRVVGLFVEVDGGLIPTDRVDFFANGIFLGSRDAPTTAADGQSTRELFSFNWVPEVPGEYELQARIVQIDPAGATYDNWKITDPVSITITEPNVGSEPEIEITNPEDGDTAVVLRQIFLQADAIDPLGSIEAVRFYVNGRQLQVTDPVSGDLVDFVDDTFPYSTNYVPRSPGQYQFVAEMLTDRGLRRQSDPVTVTVYTTDLPTGTIELPTGDTPSAGSTVQIVVDAVDPDGYIEDIVYYINGEELDTVFWTPSRPGSYELSALLVDNSGNEVLIERTVTVIEPVGTFPRVTLSVTAGGNLTPNSRVVALASVFDDAPEGVEVLFFLNGQPAGTDSEAPFYAILDPVAGFGPFGNAYSITALATDADGNSSLSSLSPLYVSDFAIQQPTIEFLNIESGDIYTRGSRVPIQVEVGGGASSNLASLVFYADGVEIGRVPGGEPSNRYAFDWTPETVGEVEITVASLLNQELYDHDRDSGGVDPTPRIPVTPVNVTFPVTVTVNETVGNLPSISLDVFPARENLTIGSKVLIYADAQDLDGSVEQVEFFRDGVSLSLDTEAPFTHVLTTERKGDFSLNALATDSSGNVVTSTVVNLGVTDRVITPTPDIALTVPDSGQEGSILSLRASTAGFVNPPEGVVFYANGQPIGDSEDVPYSYPWLANLSGTVTFFASATQTLFDGSIVTTVSNVVESDLAENLSPEITDVVVDFPNKSDVKPDPLAGELLTFRVSVSDSGPLREVELLRDGEVLKSSESPASPFEITDTPPGLGFYEYSIVVTDRGGLQAQSEVIPVSVVVGQGPVVEIIAPTDGDIVSPDATVRLEATVADPDGFITEVSFFVNGIQVGDTLTESPYAAEFSPGVAGSYTVMARARDNSGNLTEADPVTFTVPADELPQIVTFSNNLPGSVARLGQEITWSVDATDDFGLASIELLRNGTAVETEAVLPLEIVDTIRTLGRFRYVARVTDTSGQVTESEVIEITSTRGSPPVVQIVEPTSGVRIVPDGDGVVVRATANPADEPAGVPGGSIARVEFFLNGSSIGAKTTAPYLVEVDSELTVAGSNVVIAVATTDTGLTASSQEITIEQVDGSIPTILRFESDSTDGSELVGTEINFTVQATDEKGIEVVELLLFGQVVDTVTSQPYVLSYIPESPGTYSFTVRVVNTDGNDAVSEEAITISVRLPDPLGNTADFVSQTYVDLLFRLPTFAEKAEATRLLNNGSLTKDRFIRELINPADGLAESDYDAVRGALLANRFLLGIWPSRDKLEDDTGAVRDGGLSALVTSLMIDFEDSYMADTGASGLPSTLSSDAEIGDYVSYMFGLKYGVLPDAAQLSLGKLHFRAGGRDAFTASFISDAEVVATPNGWTSTGLGFNFGVGSPPDDTYLRQADAASLLINFLRVVPSDAEVEELAAKLFATQVAEVVDDPRYAARFTSTFRQLENHVDGWKYSDWFGWFNTATDPWVYHSEQGWVAFRTIGQDDQNFWYYDVEMGWIWTQADMYPVVYESRGGHWLMGLRQPYSPEAGRWFFDFNQNDWTKR